MMRSLVAAAVWLIVAAAFNGALSHRLSLGWVQPDFLLVVAVALSMRGTTNRAAWTGFVAGMFHSALWNEKMMALTISRMFACIASVHFFRAFPVSGAGAAAVVTGAATLVAGILYLFLGLPTNLVQWLVETFGGILYNAALAVPVYVLQERMASRRPTTSL
ncbi:MAG: hypothetical protein C4341_06340 [Armatimonadota bacterium]